MSEKEFIKLKVKDIEVKVKYNSEKRFLKFLKPRKINASSFFKKLKKRGLIRKNEKQRLESDWGELHTA